MSVFTVEKRGSLFVVLRDGQHPPERQTPHETTAYRIRDALNALEGHAPAQPAEDAPTEDAPLSAVLSGRALDALHAAGFSLVSEVQGLTQSAFEEIPGIGRATARRIRAALHAGE